jgi:hypothetical protein
MKYLDMSLKGQEQDHLNIIGKKVHEIAQHEETQVPEIKPRKKLSIKSNLYHITNHYRHKVNKNSGSTSLLQ